MTPLHAGIPRVHALTFRTSHDRALILSKPIQLTIIPKLEYNIHSFVISEVCFKWRFSSF